MCASGAICRGAAVVLILGGGDVALPAVAEEKVIADALVRRAVDQLSRGRLGPGFALAPILVEADQPAADVGTWNRLHGPMRSIVKLVSTLAGCAAVA